MSIKNLWAQYCTSFSKKKTKNKTVYVCVYLFEFIYTMVRAGQKRVSDLKLEL